MAGKNRPRSAPRGPGGSRTLLYVMAIIVAGFVIYYYVVPLFSSKPVHGPAIFLNPNTDIAGSAVTISGQRLNANHSITAQFNNLNLNLSGTCRTDARGNFTGCSFWVPSRFGQGAYQVTVNDGSKAVSARFTVPQYSPPVSTILVTLTSVALGFVTQIVTRAVVDLDAERRMKAEVNTFNKEKQAATAAGDKSKLEKLKKRELQVRQAQTKLSTARFKVTAITFIPLLGVYYLMATFLGGYGVIVAYAPLPIPFLTSAGPTNVVYEVSLFWWYFLSSFTFSSILSKLLHTTT
jgi:uncharacterized membrane protein (DUF106 family)